MKKSFALALFTILLAGVCSAKLLIFEGSTTIKLSGQLEEGMVQLIADGEPLHLFKDGENGYFTCPIFLEQQKNGSWGTKNPEIKASFKPKNQKYTHSDKLPFFVVFAVRVPDSEDVEIAAPMKGGFKCSGTLYDISEDDLQNYYYIALNDGQSGEDLCGWTYPMEAKGKNFVYSKKEEGASVKITLNSKGKITASLKLSEGYAWPQVNRESE